MPSLPPEQLTHVAELVRLQVADEDQAFYTQRLERILGLLHEIREIDTEGVAPLAHPAEQSLRLRPDQAERIKARSAYQQLSQTGITDAEGFYLVPAVLD